jgi:formate/nitrite transporter FocA (FNT family)
MNDVSGSRGGGANPGDEESTAKAFDEQAEEIKDRKIQRLEEDQAFVPVIVKRTDETRRHPDDVLVSAISEGLEQLNRSAVSLGLSSIAAGLILGFTAMTVGVATAAIEPLALPPLLARVLVAVGYPLGFVICLTSGAELFTEHTATAVYPVLDRKASVVDLLRLWFIVAAGNLIGSVFSAGLLTYAEPVIGARSGYVVVATHLIEAPVLPLLVSATLAGWLMALGAWLILATPPMVSQIVSIYIVTFLIGLGGLHHSIAGSVEIFTAAFVSSGFSVGECLGTIGLALVGNLIGGSLFVAVLNYAHIRETR